MGDVISLLGKTDEAKIELINGKELDIVGDDKLTVDSSVVTTRSFGDDAVIADISDLQQAILDSSDLTNLDATAAGGGGATAGGAGNGVSLGAASFDAGGHESNINATTNNLDSINPQTLNPASVLSGNIVATDTANPTEPANLTPPQPPKITQIYDDFGNKTGDVKGSVTDDKTPTIKGEAPANSQVEIFDNINGNKTSLGTTTADSDGKFEFTPTELSDGEHKFTAVATDPATNLSSQPSNEATTTIVPPIQTLPETPGMVDIKIPLSALFAERNSGWLSKENMIGTMKEFITNNNLEQNKEFVRQVDYDPNQPSKNPSRIAQIDTKDPNTGEVKTTYEEVSDQTRFYFKLTQDRFDTLFDKSSDGNWIMTKDKSIIINTNTSYESNLVVTTQDGYDDAVAKHPDALVLKDLPQNAVIFGSDYKDNIIVDGVKISQIYTGAFSDNITVQNGATINNGGSIIHGGSNMDNIVVKDGSVVKNVDGGDGDDKIEVKGADTKITDAIAGGAGNDKIVQADGAYSKWIRGDSGNDEIIVEGKGTVNGGLNGDNWGSNEFGDDTIIVRDGAHLTGEMVGQYGNDKIQITGEGTYVNWLHTEKTDGWYKDVQKFQHSNDTLEISNKAHVSHAIVDGRGDSTVNINSGAVVGDLTVHGGNNKVTIEEAKVGNVSVGTHDGYSDASDVNHILIKDSTTSNIKTGKGEDHLDIQNSKVNSLDLGAGNDTLSIKDSSTGHINTHDGNDDVTIENSKTGFLYLGSGSNTLTATGTTNDDGSKTTNITRIDTDNGLTDAVNTISLDGVKVTEFINTGDGGDKLDIKDSIVGGNINTEEGNDTITISDGAKIDKYISGGSGEDSITISDSAEVKDNIYGGDGDDTITISNTRYTNTIYADSGNTSPNDGKDTVVVKDGAFAKNIFTGGENDTITVTGEGSRVNWLKAESGDDEIFVTQKSSVGTIEGNDGDDHISVNDSKIRWIKGGAGNDTINVENNSNVTMIYGDDSEQSHSTDGNDTISVNNSEVESQIHGTGGNDDIALKNSSVSSIFSGSGDDKLQVDHTIVKASIDGGEGNDNIDINNKSKIGTAGRDYYISGGEGNDSISINNSVTHDIIHGLGGNDDIAISNGSTVNGLIVGGEGNDNILISGKDTLINQPIVGGNGVNHPATDDDSFTIIDTDLSLGKDARILGQWGNDTVNLVGEAKLSSDNLSSSANSVESIIKSHKDSGTLVIDAVEKIGTNKELSFNALKDALGDGAKIDLADSGIKLKLNAKDLLDDSKNGELNLETITGKSGEVALENNSKASWSDKGEQNGSHVVEASDNHGHTFSVAIDEIKPEIV